MIEDMDKIVLSLGCFAVFIIGLGLGFVIRWYFAGKQIREAEAKYEEAKRKLENSAKEAEIQSKDFLIKLRQDFENETKGRREELAGLEKRLLQKEENLDKRVDLLEKKEKDVDSRLEDLRKKELVIQDKVGDLNKLIDEEKQRLQKVASMTTDEAKKLLLLRLDEDLVQEKAKKIREAEVFIKDNSDKKAREFISQSIQRCASEHTAATTVTVVALPSDEMKGRIIGREGRNIRALEAAAGVDVIIDDTPELVSISGFDMFRREVARIALENLISDGRIHPGRIEEVVEKAKKEMEGVIKEEGEKTAFDLQIHGMHPELLKLVGRLKFRTSYGQNGLAHTKEVALLIGSMASLLGLDAKLAMRAGLLHDIGKVVSQDVEAGTHAVVGGVLARKVW